MNSCRTQMAQMAAKLISCVTHARVSVRVKKSYAKPINTYRSNL